MTDAGDPFAAFGSDRTVIKPKAGRAGAVPPTQSGPVTGFPGGAGSGAAAASAAAGASGGAGKEVPLSLDTMMSGSLNPLVNAALPLLVAAPRIRNTVRHPNPNGLRDALVDGIKKFEAQARARGLPNEQVIAGRYILCTLLDEAAASTPWGGSGAWSGNSLLVQFHNESWGGEKVFQLMSKLAENVDGNRNLLELLWVVLALGFQGRFRVVDNGGVQLDGVRQRLAQLLGQGRSYEKALAPRWQGVKVAAPRLVDGVPLWFIAALLLAILTCIYVGFRWSLAGPADDVFNRLAAIEPKRAQLAPPPPPVPAAVPRLAQLLAPEIRAGQVSVQDLADRSIVTIKGDGFFEPGSSVIAAPFRPLLPRIGQALATLRGKVLVTGHTDNQPIRTARFPSNWHLSQERAQVVRDELSRQVQADRLQSEGKADSQPVADNATPAGRARNRRVDVTLFVANDPAKP